MSIGRAPKSSPPGIDTLRLAAAGQQRPQDQDRRPDPLDQLVGRLRRDDRGPDDPQRRRPGHTAVVEGVGRRERDVQAHRLEQVAHDRDVGDVGDVGEVVGAVGEDGGGHQLEHGVLGSTDPDGPGQGPSGPHDDAIHGLPVWPEHGDDPGHLADSGRTGPP